MPWNWVWGEKKAPIKKIEVETINEDIPKKVTILGVKMHIALEHPLDKQPVAQMLDTSMQFLMKEGNTVQQAQITDVEVLS